ncbi:hypothetical protein [Piscirickettsia salmonis]|nr:hypothetical protein [Piscirickettsia salmonis]
MLGDFASLDVQNTYRGSDAYAAAFIRKISFYEIISLKYFLLLMF